jgi:diguanylate cyclase (GGDEF)-like protein
MKQLHDALEPAVSADGNARLLSEFGIDDTCIALLNELGGTIGRRAPQLAPTGKRDRVLSNAADAFGRPVLSGQVSDAQRALLETMYRGELTRGSLRGLLARWVIDVGDDGRLARMRVDCLQTHEQLRAAAMQLFADDRPLRERILDALERFVLLQAGTLVWSADFDAQRGRAPAAQGHAPFAQYLEECIADSRRDGGGLAVLLIDCGVVSRADAMWGYHAGDAARMQLVQRLSMAVLRERDIIGEPGRDEFALVLIPADGAGVGVVAAPNALGARPTPIQIDEDEIYARPAVGIALFPESGEDSQTLMAHAKIACHSARESIERVALYAEIQQRPHADVLRYESKLRAAINQNNLELVFQPQFDPAARRIAGLEALLRWQDGELGPVRPDKVIAVAESAGLINDVTFWVISSALRHCAMFRDRGLDVSVSINLSPNNLRERELPDFIDRGLRTWNLKPERVVVEITETAVLGPREIVDEALARLKQTGVRLSVDDFGTGYSSMSYLAAMPLDEMKIDLSFVRDMMEVPQHERIVRSMIELGCSLGLTVVAEGVESERAAQRLALLGCHRLQGFWLCPPIGAEELLRRYAPER